MSDRYTKPGPKHLRTKANSAGAGTFADDTNWAATNTLIPLADRGPIPLRRHDGAGGVSKVMVMYVALDAAGARVNRGNFVCSMTPTGQFTRPDDAAPNHDVIQWDGADSTLVPPNSWRTIDLPGGIDQFSVRLHTFANIPGTATELRVYYLEC
jgi:hypothetical protein